MTFGEISNLWSIGGIPTILDNSHTQTLNVWCTYNYHPYNYPNQLHLVPGFFCTHGTTCSLLELTTLFHLRHENSCLKQLLHNARLTCSNPQGQTFLVFRAEGNESERCFLGLRTFLQHHVKQYLIDSSTNPSPEIAGLMIMAYQPLGWLATSIWQKKVVTLCALVWKMAHPNPKCSFTHRHLAPEWYVYIIILEQLETIQFSPTNHWI